MFKIGQKVSIKNGATGLSIPEGLHVRFECDYGEIEGSIEAIPENDDRHAKFTVKLQPYSNNGFMVSTDCNYKIEAKFLSMII